MQPVGRDMTELERTSSGFQMVLPGCERRTLPKSASRCDDAGQGLLDFFKQPTAREKLEQLATAPLNGKSSPAKRSRERSR
jgi:hypothetical protein